jgi:hypothetical protein
MDPDDDGEQQGTPPANFKPTTLRAIVYFAHLFEADTADAQSPLRTIFSAPLNNVSTMQRLLGRALEDCHIVAGKVGGSCAGERANSAAFDTTRNRGHAAVGRVLDCSIKL